MAYGKYLSYQDLWRSSWKMWGLLLVLTAVPIGIFIRFADQNCMYCIKMGYLEIATLALLIALPFALLGLLVGFWYNHKAKDEVSNAFDVSYVRSDHSLAQRVHHLSDQLSLPRPQVGFMATTNAFAVGRTPDEAAVIIGTPLIQGLSPDELDAVIGHELGHIASGDMQRMQIAVGYQRLFDWVFKAVGGFIGLVLGIAVQAGGFGSAAQIARLIAELFISLGHFTFNIGSNLSIKAFSRHREFYADAVGAMLTSPDAMSRALRKINRITTSPRESESTYQMMMFRSAWDGHPFSTHPTLEARVAALDEGTYIRRATARAVGQPTAEHMQIPRIAHQGLQTALVVARAPIEWMHTLEMPHLRILLGLIAIGVPLALGALSFWVVLALL